VQESEIFAERIGVTTIDQYLTGFAGAPLSFASSSGHAVAGAIVASLSVFDEVHLLGPERGLPLLYGVLQQRWRWGLPSAVMTATLPKSVRDFLCQEVHLEAVELSEADVQARDGWREVTLRFEEAGKPVERILEAFEAHGRVIVFVNTVDAAIELYRELRQRHMPEEAEIIVAHSNFAPSHRKVIEDRLLEVFGKGSARRGICLLTQVGEAGINISAPVVFSELAPADSLIQRAGRCARFQGEPQGQFVVYKPRRDRSHVPYRKDLVERTEAALRNRAPSFRLDWRSENELVDEVLDVYYAHFIRAEVISSKGDRPKKSKKGNGTELKAITVPEVLGLLDQTFYSRRPEVLESALRDIQNVQVIVVAEEPRKAAKSESMGREDVSELSPFERYIESQNRFSLRERDRLEMIPVSYGRFTAKVKGKNLWELKLIKEEACGRPLYILQRAEKVLPNCTYLLTQAEAAYSPAIGLTFGEAEEVQAVHGLITPIVPCPSLEKQASEHRFQYFREHSLAAYRAVDSMLRRHYSAWILHIARQMEVRSVPINAEEFAQILESTIRIAALLHDIGKLNRPWQQAVGWESGPFWAKSQDGFRGELPPHAFYVFPVLRYLFSKLGVVGEGGEVDRLAELIALAAARHHSLGDPGGKLAWPPFELQDGVLQELRQLLSDALREEAEPIQTLFTEELFNHVNDATTYKLEEGKHTYLLDTPSPSEDYYPFYVLANRMIKVGDWEASSEREVELCR
jgi:CRISPR-associated endonuclease/helicase Cas3